MDEDVDAHQRELPAGYLVRLVRRARAPERETTRSLSTWILLAGEPPRRNSRAARRRRRTARARRRCRPPRRRRRPPSTQKNSSSAREAPGSHPDRAGAGSRPAARTSRRDCRGAVGPQRRSAGLGDLRDRRRVAPHLASRQLAPAARRRTRAASPGPCQPVAPGRRGESSRGGRGRRGAHSGATRRPRRSHGMRVLPHGWWYQTVISGFSLRRKPRIARVSAPTPAPGRSSSRSRAGSRASSTGSCGSGRRRARCRARSPRPRRDSPSRRSTARPRRGARRGGRSARDDPPPCVSSSMDRADDQDAAPTAGVAPRSGDDWPVFDRPSDHLSAVIRARHCSKRRQRERGERDQDRSASASAAVSSACSSWRSIRSRPASQKPGSVRSTPTIAPSSSGEREPPARSSSR